LQLEQCEDSKEFLSKNIQRLSKIFEEYIVRYPCHFGMVFYVLKDQDDKGIIETPFFQQ